MDHVKNAQSCVNRVNAHRGTYGGTYEKRACFSPGLLDPKSLILIWDTGASYGLTPFRSDFIDYVKCQILNCGWFYRLEGQRKVFLGSC